MISRIELYLSEKKFGDAEARADDLVEVGKKEPLAWFEKAKVFYTADKFDDSVYCLKMGLDIDRKPPAPWQLVGYNMLALRKFPEAIEALEYVKSAQPGNIEAITALAFAYLYSGNPTRFEFNLKFALDTDMETALKVIVNFFERAIEKNPTLSGDSRERARAAIEGLMGKK